MLDPYELEVDEPEVELPEVEDFVEEEVQLDELEVWELLLPHSLHKTQQQHRLLLKIRFETEKWFSTHDFLFLVKE